MILIKLQFPFDFCHGSTTKYVCIEGTGKRLRAKNRISPVLTSPVPTSQVPTSQVPTSQVPTRMDSRM